MTMTKPRRDYHQRIADCCLICIHSTGTCPPLHCKKRRIVVADHEFCNAWEPRKPKEKKP